jgi:hypothetical protein
VDILADILIVADSILLLSPIQLERGYKTISESTLDTPVKDSMICSLFLNNKATDTLASVFNRFVFLNTVQAHLGDNGALSIYGLADIGTMRVVRLVLDLLVEQVKRILPESPPSTPQNDESMTTVVATLNSIRSTPLLNVPDWDFQYDPEDGVRISPVGHDSVDPSANTLGVLYSNILREYMSAKGLLGVHTTTHIDVVLAGIDHPEAALNHLKRNTNLIELVDTLSILPENLKRQFKAGLEYLRVLMVFYSKREDIAPSIKSIFTPGQEVFTHEVLGLLASELIALNYGNKIVIDLLKATHNIFRLQSIVYQNQIYGADDTIQSQTLNKISTQLTKVFGLEIHYVGTNRVPMLRLVVDAKQSGFGGSGKPKNPFLEFNALERIRTVPMEHPTTAPDTESDLVKPEAIGVGRYPEPSPEFTSWVGDISHELQSTLSPGAIEVVSSGVLSLSPLLESLLGFDFVNVQESLVQNIAAIGLLIESSQLSPAEKQLYNGIVNTLSSENGQLFAVFEAVRDLDSYSTRVFLSLIATKMILRLRKMIQLHESLRSKLSKNQVVTLDRIAQGLISAVSLFDNLSRDFATVSYAQYNEAVDFLLGIAFANNVANQELYSHLVDHARTLSLKFAIGAYPLVQFSEEFTTALMSTFQAEEVFDLPFITVQADIIGLDLREFDAVVIPELEKRLDDLRYIQEVLVPKPQSERLRSASYTPSAELTQHISELPTLLSEKLTPEAIEAVVSGMTANAQLLDCIGGITNDQICGIAEIFKASLTRTHLSKIGTLQQSVQRKKEELSVKILYLNEQLSSMTHSISSYLNTPVDDCMTDLYVRAKFILWMLSYSLGGRIFDKTTKASLDQVSKNIMSLLHISGNVDVEEIQTALYNLIYSLERVAVIVSPIDVFDLPTNNLVKAKLERAGNHSISYALLNHAGLGLFALKDTNNRVLLTSDGAVNLLGGDQEAFADIILRDFGNLAKVQTFMTMPSGVSEIVSVPCDETPTLTPEISQSQMYSDLAKVFSNHLLVARVSLAFLKSTPLFARLESLSTRLVEFIETDLLPHLLANTHRPNIADDDKRLIHTSEAIIVICKDIIISASSPIYFKNICMLSMVCEIEHVLRLYTKQSDKNRSLQNSFGWLLSGRDDYQGMVTRLSSMRLLLHVVFQGLIAHDHTNTLGLPTDNDPVQHIRSLDSSLVSTQLSREHVGRLEKTLPELQSLLCLSQHSETYISTVDTGTLNAELSVIFGTAIQPGVVSWIADNLARYQPLLTHLESIYDQLVESLRAVLADAQRQEATLQRECDKKKRSIAPVDIQKKAGLIRLQDKLREIEPVLEEICDPNTRVLGRMNPISIVSIIADINQLLGLLSTGTKQQYLSMLYSIVSLNPEFQFNKLDWRLVFNIINTLKLRACICRDIPLVNLLSEAGRKHESSQLVLDAFTASLQNALSLSDNPSNPGSRDFSIGNESSLESIVQPLFDSLELLNTNVTIPTRVS